MPRDSVSFSSSPRSSGSPPGGGFGEARLPLITLSKFLGPSLTDPKERGRFVELFYLQAEKGEGIATHLVDLAIKKYHAKHALLEVKEAEGD